MKMPLYRATWHYIAEIYVCNAKGKSYFKIFPVQQKTLSLPQLIT